MHSAGRCAILVCVFLASRVHTTREKTESVPKDPGISEKKRGVFVDFRSGMTDW